MFSTSFRRLYILLAAAATIYFATGTIQAASAQAVPPAPQTHLMWNCTDGRISFWRVGDDGSLSSKEYGPFPGWTAKALADGADGVTNILWTRTSDGMVSLWRIDSAGNLTYAGYGPYPGWSATALSRYAPGAGDGSGTLTGVAGGDLFGLFPNPTVAANAIDHTKLASDAASLSQVSAGRLTSPDSSHISVQGALTVGGDLGLGSGLIAASNDINIFRNTTVHGNLISSSGLITGGDIHCGGTVISLTGNGGGVGNNSKVGRALVDDGTNGLVLNYGNDFGKVTVRSDLATDGTINSGVDINAVRFIHSGSNIFSDLGVLAAGDMYAKGNITCDNTLTGKTLQITGGSDLAEPYKIAPAAQVQPLPGMVVSIDPDQTGQMRVCARAYDNTVGGIISGAGGVQPGVVLRQTGTAADGTLPIASVGRVWCWCDADAGGAITPGDLLTTSATPGHAMRVRDHDRARGAILGKAMSPLRSGKGLVLVLVTLE